MMFSTIYDVMGSTCAQVYWGLSSHFINVYGMQTESEGPHTLDDFAHKEGVPPVVRNDNSRMQCWGSAGSAKCAIGSARQNSPSHINPSKTPLSSALSNGSRGAAISSDNAQVHQNWYGSMPANI